MRVFVNGCTGGVGEATAQIARMLGATVAGSCSAGAMERARSIGMQAVFDYRRTDLSKIGERFDVVYDTAATMTTAMGLGLLSQAGVFLDINPTPGKFIRSIFNRRLKPIVCTPRFDILDGLARAAGEDSCDSQSPRSCPSAKRSGSSPLLKRAASSAGEVSS
jgi:NADPH:quinone reductase-like Zn-dependent oxidoreductase